MNNNKVKETEVSSLEINKTALSKSKFKKFVDFKYALNVLDKYDSEKTLSEMYLDKAIECEKVIQSHLKKYKAKNILITIDKEEIQSPKSTKLGKSLLKNAFTNKKINFTITNVKTNKSYYYYYDNDTLMVKEVGSLEAGQPASSTNSISDTNETVIAKNDIF